MCGRYTLSTPGDEVAAVFGLEESVSLEPRFNIAPSQQAPVVRRDGDGRRYLAACRWGFVPHWSDDPEGGPRPINARSETVAEKPAFRDSFRRRRCLVVGDGFYEWKATGGAKQPFYFSLADGEPFAMAGLWDRWGNDGTPLETFAILTAPANREVAAVHDRMPLILAPEAWTAWLGADEAGMEVVRDVLAQSPRDGLLLSRPVSTRVNSPANDDSRLVERVEPEDADRLPPRLF